VRDQAVAVVKALGIPQSQDSLWAQTIEALPVVEAMGLYDLADFLRKSLGPMAEMP
jgi:hypothetical protein